MAIADHHNMPDGSLFVHLHLNIGERNEGPIQFACEKYLDSK